MDSETILCEKKGRITYITLNRPEVLNAINNTLRRELLAAVEEFDRDEEAWVAILSGAGRAFCSGGDVKDRERPDPRLVHGPGMLPASNLLLSCTNGKPVIAAVHGYAVGGGLFYTLACDLAVAADNTKFQFTEVARGLGGGGGWASLWFWGGAKFASEMSIIPRLFSAQEAYQFGMINRVVPLGQQVAEAESLAEDIMSYPQESVRAQVRISRWYAQRATEEASLYTSALRTAGRSEDRAEYDRAFLEKRKPVFKDR